MSIQKLEYKTCTRYRVFYKKDGRKYGNSKTFDSEEEAKLFNQSLKTNIDTKKVKGWGYV